MISVRLASSSVNKSMYHSNVNVNFPSNLFSYLLFLSLNQYSCSSHLQFITKTINIDFQSTLSIVIQLSTTLVRHQCQCTLGQCLSLCFLLCLSRQVDHFSLQFVPAPKVLRILIKTIILLQDPHGLIKELSFPSRFDCVNLRKGRCFPVLVQQINPTNTTTDNGRFQSFLDSKSYNSIGNHFFGMEHTHAFAKFNGPVVLVTEFAIVGKKCDCNIVPMITLGTFQLEYIRPCAVHGKRSKTYCHVVLNALWDPSWHCWMPEERPMHQGYAERGRAQAREDAIKIAKM